MAKQKRAVRKRPLPVARPPADRTPSEQLARTKSRQAEVERNLADVRKKEAQLKQELETMNAAVATLEGPLSETDKLLAEYEAVLPRLTTERDAMSKLVSKYKRQLRATIADKFDQVWREIADIDSEIVDAQEHAKLKAAELKNALDALNTTKEKLREAENAFADAKQEVNNRIKSTQMLNDIEGRVKAENDQKKKVYFLKNLEDQMKSLVLKDPAEARANLERIISTIKTHKDALTKQNGDVAPVRKMADDAKKTADGLVAARITKIFEAIAKV